jgi:hypothetical protein
MRSVNSDIYYFCPTFILVTRWFIYKLKNNTPTVAIAISNIAKLLHSFIYSLFFFLLDILITIKVIKISIINIKTTPI